MISWSTWFNSLNCTSYNSKILWRKWIFLYSTFELNKIAISLNLSVDECYIELIGKVAKAKFTAVLPSLCQFQLVCYYWHYPLTQTHCRFADIRSWIQCPWNHQLMKLVIKDMKIYDKNCYYYHAKTETFMLLSTGVVVQTRNCLHSFSLHVIKSV